MNRCDASASQGGGGRAGRGAQHQRSVPIGAEHHRSAPIIEDRAHSTDRAHSKRASTERERRGRKYIPTCWAGRRARPAGVVEGSGAGRAAAGGRSAEQSRGEQGVGA